MYQKSDPYLERVSVYLVGEPLTDYKVSDSAEAGSLARQYMRQFDREHMVALFLDTANQLQSIHEVSVGTLSSAPVHPREVFKAAILANAAKVIVAHNHLSGDPSPSKDDKIVTERLRDAGDLLGIPLIDHLIIGKDAYYSFAEMNEI